MSAGSLIGGIVTLFGAIAGGALVAKGINPDLPVDPIQAWVIFVLCFGAGVLMLLSFSRNAGTSAAMQWPGAVAIILGVIAGGIALAKTLGAIPPGGNASLWALFALSLPPGVLLMHGAAAMRGHVALEPK